jgi:uncharacterized membrane protein YoaK (UPF0700 family)
LLLLFFVLLITEEKMKGCSRVLLLVLLCQRACSGAEAIPANRVKPAQQQQQDSAFVRRTNGESSMSSYSVLLESKSPLTTTATAPKILSAAAPTSVSDRPLKSQSSVLTVSHARKQTFITLLGIICGATDVIFVNHFKCYANMMTGNTMKCATALASGEWQTAARFALLVVCFTTGSSLFQLLTLNVKPTDKRVDVTKMRLLRISPIVLFIFTVADVVARVVHPSTFLPILALAFGLLNTAIFDSVGTITYATTGHLTKIGIGAVDCVLFKKMFPMDNMQFIVTFVASIIASTKVYQWIVSASSVHRIPQIPMGLTLGCLYYVLLAWYSSVPCYDSANLESHNQQPAADTTSVTTPEPSVMKPIIYALGF